MFWAAGGQNGGQDVKITAGQGVRQDNRITAGQGVGLALQGEAGGRISRSYGQLC